jgi:flavin reductase (DIM6/NTAB) family NADH-FMN oxidoreductase RutF
MLSDMGTETLSSIVASLDPALIVVTTAVGDERAGCLVGFHAQSSLDPERYCVWLSKANHTYRVALRATHFAVHFLTQDDMELAERFGTRSGDSGDKFDGLDVTTSAGGVPVLGSCPHRWIGERAAILDEGGDHVLISARVVESVTSGPFRPFRLSQADGLQPGHVNTERHGPPTERAGPAARRGRRA